MRRIIGAVAVLIGLASPAWAGIEIGLAAYLRGDFGAAERAYRQLAEIGDPAAQFGLGLLYHFGEGVPQDHVEAVRWYGLAALQGEARAQYYLGDMYRRGHGVARDYTVATWWYISAADQGYTEAQYALGLMYRGGLGVARDDAEAVRWFRQAAEQGLVRAKAFLAHMYDIGQGVSRDRVEAARWYRAAAEQGDARSQVRLAKIYDHGDGVPRDYVEAANWYRKIAERGDTEARFRLGVMHYNGEGVTQDDIQAHKWFDLAASPAAPGGNRDEASKNRDIVARRMNPAQIAEARDLADLWRTEQHAAGLAPLVPKTPTTRQRVYRIQHGLASIGYGHGSADGIFGPRTRAAIRAFQSGEGMPPTGKISNHLEAALRSATPPSRAGHRRGPPTQ